MVSSFSLGESTPLFICAKSELDFAPIRAIGSPKGSILQRSFNPFKALNENRVKKFAWLPGPANPVIHQQQRGGGGGWWGGWGDSLRERNDFNSAFVWLLVPLAPAGHHEQ